MPTNYVGNEANTQAPSAKPEPEANVTVALPADGDPPSASTFIQAYKVLADFVDFLMHPQAKAALTPRFLHRYLTRVGHTRWALDRNGLPAGTYLQWQEHWGRDNFVGGAGAVAFDAMLGGWDLVIVGSGDARTSMDVLANFAELRSTDALDDFAALWSPRIHDFHAQTDMAVETAIALLDTVVDIEVIFGMARHSAIDVSAPQGLRFVATPGLANWQALATGPSGTTLVDTGVARSAGTWKRFRIEFRGSDVNDGGAGGAYFFIEGNHVATITTNLPVTDATAKKRVLFAMKNVTGSAPGALQTVQIRPINFVCQFSPPVTT